MRLSSGKIVFLCLFAYGLLCLLLYLTLKKNYFVNFVKFFVLGGVVFGLLALSYVLKGVLEFNNSEKSYEELKEEMSQAEKKLKSMGFSFDQYNINLSHDQQKQK